MSIISDISADPLTAKAEIVDITIRKHNGTDVMSLMPQFIELNVYQSIVQALMTGELLIVDPIGMHVNYPVIGEEIIEVTLKATRSDVYDASFIQGEANAEGNQRIKLEFMISDVSQMEPDEKARSTVYKWSLYGLPMYHNTKWRVQRAFSDSITNVIKTILKDYLKIDKDQGAFKNGKEKIKDINFEESKGTAKFIVPNLQPFAAINWMTSRAVASDPKHSLFAFYENFDGFHFKTVQKMFETAKEIGKGGKVTGDVTRNSHKFLYISNINPTIRSQISMAKLDAHVITAMAINKRYSTLEKIIAGFYENEWYEIDIFNKRINNVQTSVKDKPENTLEKGQLNTQKFLEDAKIRNDNEGTKTRVRYRVGQNGGDDPGSDGKTYFDEKFGEGTRAMAALAQVFLTIAVPGNTKVQAGDIVWIELPELHGFEIVKEDRYIAGKYLVVNAKHSLKLGEQYYMTLDLARDSFTNDIEDKTRYNLGGN